MKKALKILLAIIVALTLLAWAYVAYNAERNRAVPAESALAALYSDDEVRVTDDKWLIMEPANGQPTTGIILYPGAHCDVRGYSEIIRPLAAAGYFVVAVKMPYDFSIFAPNRADAVRAAYPDIRNWIIAGHSMGGAMAGSYAYNNPDKLAGVLFLDSYPPSYSSLADSPLPSLHIHRATLAGEPPEKFQQMRGLFAPDSVWVPVPGGIHMYFGAFIGGAYNEEWEPQISIGEQHTIIVDAMLDWLQQFN